MLTVVYIKLKEGRGLKELSSDLSVIGCGHIQRVVYRHNYNEGKTATGRSDPMPSCNKFRWLFPGRNEARLDQEHLASYLIHTIVPQGSYCEGVSCRAYSYTFYLMPYVFRTLGNISES